MFPVFSDKHDFYTYLVHILCWCLMIWDDFQEYMFFVLKHTLLNLDMPIYRSTAMLQIPLNVFGMLIYGIFFEIALVCQGSVNLPVCISVTLYKSTSFFSIVMYTVVLAVSILKPNESVWHFNFYIITSKMNINFHFNCSFFYECHIFPHADTLEKWFFFFLMRKRIIIKKIKSVLKVVAHTYNPNIWEGEATGLPCI